MVRYKSQPILCSTVVFLEKENFEWDLEWNVLVHLDFEDMADRKTEEAICRI